MDGLWAILSPFALKKNAGQSPITSTLIYFLSLHNSGEALLDSLGHSSHSNLPHEIHLAFQALFSCHDLLFMPQICGSIAGLARRWSFYWLCSASSFLRSSLKLLWECRAYRALELSGTAEIGGALVSFANSAKHADIKPGTNSVKAAPPPYKANAPGVRGGQVQARGNRVNPPSVNPRAPAYGQGQGMGSRSLRWPFIPDSQTGFRAYSWCRCAAESLLVALLC